MEYGSIFYRSVTACICTVCAIYSKIVFGFDFKCNTIRVYCGVGSDSDCSDSGQKVSRTVHKEVRINLKLKFTIRKKSDKI